MGNYNPGLSNFRLLAISALLMLLCLNLQSQKKGDTISFIHLTDTHVCNLTGYHPFFAKSREHYGNGAAPFNNFLKSVPGDADFAVLTGDMTDYYEAQSVSGNMLDTEVEQFARHLDASAGIPVYLALGNHDIATYWVNSEKSYTSNQLNAEEARASWSRNLSCFRDGTYYSRIYKAGNTTYRLIFLDNAYYHPDFLAMPSKLKKEKEPIPYVIDEFQLFWLENQLKESDNDHEIILMHMPLLGGVERPSGSVIEKTTLKSTCSLYEMLAKYPSVELIISGHKHRNVVHKFSFGNGNTVTQVETGVFGGNPDNWRIFKLVDNKIIVSKAGTDSTEFSVLVD